MVSYMKRQAGPPSLFLEDLAAVKKFINSPEEVIAVGFFSSSTSATTIDSFIESGNLVRQDIRLGHTTDSKIAEKLKFDLNSVIVYHPKKLVSKYEKGYSEIPNIEQETSEDLRLTLTQAAKPLVGQVTLENFGSLYTHRPLLVAYYDVDWDRESVEGQSDQLVYCIIIMYNKLLVSILYSVVLVLFILFFCALNFVF